jgi:hypothetical protein
MDLKCSLCSQFHSLSLFLSLSRPLALDYDDDNDARNELGEGRRKKYMRQRTKLAALIIREVKEISFFFRVVAGRNFYLLHYEAIKFKLLRGK